MKDLSQLLLGGVLDDAPDDEWDQMPTALTPAEATEAYSRQLARHGRLRKASGAGSEIGFVPPYLASMSLPHSEPPNRATYTRKVPPDVTGASWAKMTLRCNPEFGVPYGAIPRLLFNYVISYVVQRKDRRVPLGRSRRECAEIIGARDSGETLSSIDRNINALTHSTWDIDMLVHCTCPDTGRKIRRPEHRVFQLAKGGGVDFVDDQQHNIWECYVDVNEELFRSLTSANPKPRPFNFDAYRALQRSPFQMDLYLWYTTAAAMGPAYRDFKIKDLMRMFGTQRDPSNPKAVSAFKKILLEHTGFIQKHVFPVKVESAPYSRTLRVYKPERPHVDPKHASFFYKNAKLEETYTDPELN